jgi:hypothetical protein
VGKGISGTKENGAKTAGVTKTQSTPRGKDDFNVIMTIEREGSGEISEGSGHAQVKKERAFAIEMKKQIFCPATNRKDVPPFQGGGEISGDQNTQSRLTDNNFSDG